MRIWKYLLLAVVLIILPASVSSATQSSLTLDLRADDKNPSIPVMGDHLRFWSSITNMGATPVEGMVAWISLVEIDPGNEQPVDLEDWSAHKAITGATLGPDQSLRTDWRMRLIKGGDYRVVVSVTIRGSNTVITSPTLQFHVRQKPVLQAGRVLPVAAGVPLLIIGLLVFHKTWQRLRKGHVCS